ncbi:adenosine deaminase [Nonomuraea rubra]|uniref:adenosine deaminase n=1 Tax=Nonomuraea rubra TaxID=46180 RepID=UPI003384EF57
MKDFIAGLPKCELHLHIEGTLEPELKFELAARNGLELPYASVAEMRAAYTFDSLSSFLTIYYEGMKVLRTEPDFYDLATAYLTKAAEQNVRYAEIFFDPQAHTSRGVPFDVVIRGLRRALMDAHARLGVRAQLIMCFLRDFQAEYAMATLLESLPYKEWIAGVGLDSDEKGNPPRKFAAVYERARQEGYLLTMHCDVDQDDAVEHIRQAVEEIGVDRIDHGVNILEDQRLVELVLARGTGLTCCHDLQRLRHRVDEGRGHPQADGPGRAGDDQLRRPGLLRRLRAGEPHRPAGGAAARSRGAGSAPAQRLRDHLAAQAPQGCLSGRDRRLHLVTASPSG